MSFGIEHEQINGRHFIHLRNDDIFTATIVPSVGAMLHAIEISLNGQMINLVDNYAPDAISKETVSNWFKGVKLSPWPCRISNGHYQFANKMYQLKKMFHDGSALHGLLYDQSFNVEQEQADSKSAMLTLQHSYQADDAGYPFAYDCIVRFALYPNRKLQLQTTILNKSAVPIPIADGWHPYFQLGGQLDNWELYFAAGQMICFDARLIPTGKLDAYARFNEPKPIEDISMDNCFMIDPEQGKPVCSLRNPANKIALHIYTDPSYPFLQLFIPPHRRSIAIENLSSAPDAFNNKIGLVVLEPGASRQFSVFYQVEVEENG